MSTKYINSYSVKRADTDELLGTTYHRGDVYAAKRFTATHAGKLTSFIKMRGLGPVIGDKEEFVPLGESRTAVTTGVIVLKAAQKQALAWLKNRGGDGVFARHNVLLAQGEEAGVSPATWAALRDAGYVEVYTGNGKLSHGNRLRVTDRADEVNTTDIVESYTVRK